MCANLKIRISVTVTKIPTMARKPAFNPRKSINKLKIPSGVSGTTKSFISTFDGSANFVMLPAALITNNINKIIETHFAYFLSFGNFCLIPLARIAPCNKPTPNTIAKVIRKFSSASCRISNVPT